MATILNADFNTGPAGAVITPAASGFDSVTGVDPTYSSDAHDGSFACQFSTAGNNGNWRDDFTAIGSGWWSFYVEVPSAPSVTVTLASWYNGTTLVGTLRLNTDGTLSLRDNFTTVATTANSLVNGNYNRISLFIDPGSATGHRILTYIGTNRDGSTPTQDLSGAATANGQTQLSNFRLGVLTNSTFTIRYDRYRSDDASEPAGVGGGGGAQTITLASGIASGEAFGSLVVGVGGQTIEPASIAQGVTDAVMADAMADTMGTVTGGDQFGTPVVTQSTAAQVIALATHGITSAEAFGTAALTGVGQIAPQGIASAEAFGSFTSVLGAITIDVTDGGIYEGAIGALTVSNLGDLGQTITGVGAIYEGAIGTPTVDRYQRKVRAFVREAAAGTILRYNLDVGVTLLKESGTWRAVRSPQDSRVSAAEKAYRGGYEYQITAEEQQELVDAGFGGFVVLEEY